MHSGFAETEKPKIPGITHQGSRLSDVSYSCS
jgi:hypothetical protein